MNSVNNKNIKILISCLEPMIDFVCETSLSPTSPVSSLYLSSLNEILIYFFEIYAPPYEQV